MMFARAVVDHWPGDAYVFDVLRWKTPIMKAHEGGERDPLTLLDLLDEPLEPITRGMRVVLVDDVMTKGGHMAACARLLAEHGAAVRLGVVAAHAVHEHQRSAGDVFMPRTITIEVPKRVRF